MARRLSLSASLGWAEEDEKRPGHGAVFLAKTGQISSKRPLTKQKGDKRPSHTVNAPPTMLGGKRPGAELANNLSVGDGAVSEPGKRVVYTPVVGKLKPYLVCV